MMVQRMIGSKVGTAGSSGYQYLKSTIRLVQETLSFHVLQTEGYLTKFCTGRGHPEVQSLTLCLPLLTKKVSPYMPSIKKIVSHSYAWRSLVSSVRRSRVHLFELERPLECLSGSFLYPFPYRSSWNPYRSCREVLDWRRCPDPLWGAQVLLKLKLSLCEKKEMKFTTFLLLLYDADSLNLSIYSTISRYDHISTDTLTLIAQL